MRLALLAAAVAIGGVVTYGALPAAAAAPVPDRDCADFADQAAALAELAADPSDPHRLDADDDGVPCEGRFGDGVTVAPDDDPVLAPRFDGSAQDWGVNRK